ncbi:BgTH12-07979 [Blumeria graminis f. sp. triticale]|uniref:Bgt-3674 n=3 Tax=Blumeria graminis TaxID=34373 RepID=A0A381LG24_BLUGR|nr:hypothetical protein BGT96224_3674 [Blumeria graminis f. sp. tritici 96224]CAD6505213.1 BgTH12-07979 [Blumeria graminis f. sp. triticale]VDB93226.1 Bgt-3674 [Blumeria graminis f. sp. tritici]
MEKSLLRKNVLQKILRRSTMAKNQVARRLAKQKAKEERDQRKSDREGAIHHYRLHKDLVSKERLARREDWELAGLAPKRDVGNQKETYGAVDGQLIQGPKLTKEQSEERMKDFGGRFLSLFIGDRVVLLEGRDKGRIGKVIKIDRDRAECTVEGLNLIDVKLPQYMRAADPNDTRAVRTIEKAISIASVRLVYPLVDSETGVTREVIIKRLVNGPIFHDKHMRTARWARIVPGLNITIPWPKKEPPQHQDQAADTLRLDVDVKNFVPTLLTPPMPPSVIDELRNKYSKFRTRHDSEYIEKKMSEEAESLEQLSKAKLMRTPLKEAAQLQRKVKKAKGRDILTPDMLTKIGTIIAKTRGTSMPFTEIPKSQDPLTTSC